MTLIYTSSSLSSHCLAVEMLRRDDIPRHQRLCQFCDLGEVEDETHFLLRCPVYYEIRGRYHCLYRDGPHTLRSFMAYPDPRCLGLLLREMMLLRSSMPIAPTPLCTLQPCSLVSGDSSDDVDLC